MSTQLKPWPPEIQGYQEMLKASRRISLLATGIAEECWPVGNVYLEKRWLKLIKSKGLTIQNLLKAIYKGKRNTDQGTPTWVRTAITMLHYHSGEIVKQAEAALRDIDNNNPKAAENKVLNLMEAGHLMEGYLLEGPPPENGAEPKE